MAEAMLLVLMLAFVFLLVGYIVKMEKDPNYDGGALFEFDRDRQSPAKSEKKVGKRRA
jgi:hypothetical protein